MGRAELSQVWDAPAGPPEVVLPKDGDDFLRRANHPIIAIYEAYKEVILT